ncbi:MAG: nucleoside hydrolase [Bacteroidales bacterium]
MKRITLFLLLAPVLILAGCSQPQSASATKTARIPVILDTDANNELDDQHAIAYLLMNRESFDVAGITVNATWGGGPVEKHYEEAVRIVKLCGLQDTTLVYKGVNGNFEEISKHLNGDTYDGAEAVEFMIREAEKEREQPLVIIAVGKLTNVALALKKAPVLAEKIRLVWLGSNYPEPGEYNQDNDTVAMNYLLNCEVPFEMVTVRYGQPSGTAAVTVTQQEINRKMPGLGPLTSEPVPGRHGGTFNCFGDYSVSLFEYIHYDDDQRSRALFDMAAVAIVKDPSWADSVHIPAPILTENQWMERPGNPRTIAVWQNFNREAILTDFFHTLEQATPR